MPKSPSSRDDLEGLLRDLSTRLERQERHTHNFPPPAPPGPAPAPPYVAPPVETCTTWSDGFTDMAAWYLNPDFSAFFGPYRVLPTATGGYMEGIDRSGDSVPGGIPSGTFATNSATHVAPAAGAVQFVEVNVGDMWQRYDPPAGFEDYLDAGLRGDIRLWTHIDPAVPDSGTYALLAWANSITPDLPPIQSTLGVRVAGLLVHPFGDPFDGLTVGDQTFRVETHPDGRQVCFLNGTEVLDFTGPPPGAGAHQAIELVWDTQWVQPVPSAIHSPRIFSATGGCLEL